MDIDILKLFAQAVISISAAFLAAWLATKRFRSDKLWERKMEAYSELVDALHKMKFPPSEHFDAAIEHREINDDYSLELWALIIVWPTSRGATSAVPARL